MNNDSQVCAWCSKSIPANAVKCPYCQKWRKDIDRDRIIAYVWGFIAAIPGSIIGISLVNNKSFLGTGRGTLAILSAIRGNGTDAAIRRHSGYSIARTYALDRRTLL